MTDIERATWDGLQAEATERSAKVPAAVEAAIRAMRAGGLDAGFGFAEEDAIATWSARLASHDPAAIMTAAGEFIEAGGEVPQLTDFIVVVDQVQRRADHPPKRKAGEECSECGASDEERGGVTYLTPPGEGGISDQVPCSLCRPEQREMWEAGHFLPRLENQACSCRHALCPSQRRRAARRK
jgi:hypothetical protein